MITPIEIKQHTFAKSIRGYDTEEVRTFLKNLSEIWSKETEENRRLRSELEKAKESLQQYRDMENLLQRTLMQAEQTSKNTIDNAQREAELYIKEAKQQSQFILQQTIQEKKKTEDEIQELIKRKNDIIFQLKNFLNNQLDAAIAFENLSPFIERGGGGKNEKELDCIPLGSASPFPANTGKAASENDPLAKEAATSFFDEVFSKWDKGNESTIINIIDEL
jgi:cell division initiation protein